MVILREEQVSLHPSVAEALDAIRSKIEHHEFDCSGADCTEPSGTVVHWEIEVDGRVYSVTASGVLESA